VLPSSALFTADSLPLLLNRTLFQIILISDFKKIITYCNGMS
jgi:hypothetical protein